jgi:hypothetical protein
VRRAGLGLAAACALAALAAAGAGRSQEAPPGSPARAPAPAGPSAPGGKAVPPSAPMLETAGPPAPRAYDLRYEARLVPSERVARVTVRLGRGAGLVRWVRLAIDPERHVDFRGDGAVEPEAGAVVWRPPAAGGALHYTFRIDHLRDATSYDAHVTEQWALFRGDDLVPPARVDTEPGALARARLRLRLPDGWSAAVPFERLPDGRFAVENPERRFDRPTGWLLLGRLGVLREKVAGAHLVVAAPTGQGARRLDLLALLRWSLPALRDVLGGLPARLLVASAGDPMWRGGLSGPRSVFVHVDRPLIDRDGTSPLLHELFHAAVPLQAGPGGDWVVEGLAELYSLELLARSKTIGRVRYRKALRRFAERGAGVVALDVDPAVGPVAARAVSALHALDGELRTATQERVTLDQVVARLAAERGELTTERFRQLVDEVAGRSLGAFFRAQIPLKAQPALP